MPTRLLREAGHGIAVFYANSNIAPAAEYEKRLAELRRYASAQGLSVIEGAYDPQAWERAVAPIGEAIKRYSPAFGRQFAARPRDADPRETASGATEQAPAAAPRPAGDSAAAAPCPAGEAAADAPATVAELLDDERRRERCRACYRLRLEEAAEQAAEGGYDGLATTLAVSPYQFSDVIREELERACAHAGVKPHFQDFRPYYDEATRISRELGMYRQNYCGCRFSVQEGQATRAFVKQQRKLQKEARRAQQEARDDARRERAAEKRAYADARARKRAILKSLRQGAEPFAN